MAKPWRHPETQAVGNGHLEPGMELLTKPFTLDDLTRKVRSMLGQTATKARMSR